jgi:hypothetical protein
MQQIGAPHRRRTRATCETPPWYRGPAVDLSVAACRCGACGQGGNTEHFTGSAPAHAHAHAHPQLVCTQFPPLRGESSVLKHPSPPRNDCYHLKWLLSFFSNDCYCIIILCDDVTRDHAALCPWAGPPGAHADLSGRQYVAGRGPLAQARACHHLGSGRPAPTRQAPACRPIASRLK